MGLNPETKDWLKTIAITIVAIAWGFSMNRSCKSESKNTPKQEYSQHKQDTCAMLVDSLKQNAR